MLFPTIVFALFAFASPSLAKECPKIVTQKDFDITKVSLLLYVNRIISYALLLFSISANGMKLFELMFSLKLELDVLMQHIRPMLMEL